MVVQICTYDDATLDKLTHDNGMNLNWLEGVTYPTIILPHADKQNVFGFLNAGTPTIPRICPDHSYAYEHPTPNGTDPSANYTLAGLTSWMTDHCGVETGVEGIKVTDKVVNVYPNPAKDILNIEGLENTNYDFELINMLGEKVLNLKNNTNNSINISNLKNGVYFASFKYEDKIITNKIIIQK